MTCNLQSHNSNILQQCKSREREKTMQCAIYPQPMRLINRENQNRCCNIEWSSDIALLDWSDQVTKMLQVPLFNSLDSIRQNPHIIFLRELGIRKRTATSCAFTAWQQLSLKSTDKTYFDAPRIRLALFTLQQQQQHVRSLFDLSMHHEYLFSYLHDTLGSLCRVKAIHPFTIKRILPPVVKLHAQVCFARQEFENIENEMECFFILQVNNHIIAHVPAAQYTPCPTEAKCQDTKTIQATESNKVDNTLVHFEAQIDYALPALVIGDGILNVVLISTLDSHKLAELPILSPTAHLFAQTFMTHSDHRALIKKSYIDNTAWLVDKEKGLVALKRHLVCLNPRQPTICNIYKRHYTFTLELDEVLTYIDLCVQDARHVLRERKRVNDGYWHLPRNYWEVSDDDDDDEQEKSGIYAPLTITVNCKQYNLEDEAIDTFFNNIPSLSRHDHHKQPLAIPCHVLPKM